MQCRFCLEDDVKDNLISPCKCNGSIKYIHRECLNDWIKINPEMFYQCPTCKYYYYYKPKNYFEFTLVLISKYILFHSRKFFMIFSLINQILGYNNYTFHLPIITGSLSSLVLFYFIYSKISYFKLSLFILFGYLYFYSYFYLFFFLNCFFQILLDFNFQTRMYDLIEIMDLHNH